MSRLCKVERCWLLMYLILSTAGVFDWWCCVLICWEFLCGDVIMCVIQFLWLSGYFFVLCLLWCQLICVIYVELELLGSAFFFVIWIFALLFVCCMPCKLHDRAVLFSLGLQVELLGFILLMLVRCLCFNSYASFCSADI